MHVPFVRREARPKSIHDVNPVRVLLFGRPIKTAHQDHARLRKTLALPVFASDAISSVAYASQEILLVLGAAGLWALTYRDVYSRLAIGVTIGIVCLLAVVVFSYWQTIFAYPSGGGSYIVSKDNLGTIPGLIAASALLIDYVLTVSVSIASGVQNLVATPFMVRHGLNHHVVLLCALFIALIALANLRGLRESGTVFAIPTYFFVGMAALMVALGLMGPTLIGWRLHTADVETEYARVAASAPPMAPGGLGALSGWLLIALILRAFANGCSAMTGTEAVSNGIPAFRRPESRNAALTLVAMAVILGGLFLGITALAMRFHVVYQHGSPAVIDQLSGVVFGKTGSSWRVALYYMMQLATMAVLVLAANTSFADFPRLSAILARDRFMPRQFTNQADKLVFSNGILALGALAVALIVAFNGSVDRLIPLYAVGVFTAFTLSQSGMVVHWLRLRGAGWYIKTAINGLGAICTGIVALVIAAEKWEEGAWIVIVVAAILVTVFAAIARHYEFVRRALTLTDWRPDSTPFSNTVLLLVPSLHKGVFPALRYARSISADYRAIHVETDPVDTPRLRREWEQYVDDDFPLVILPSPYRSLIGPLTAYVEEARKERPNHMITVVVPEFVPGPWYQALLHNANGLLVKLYLSRCPGVVVSNIRYFLGGHGQGPASASPSGNGALPSA